MRRATEAVVEDVLRSYPALCAALEERERYIEALCRNRGEGGMYEGGERMSEQEALFDRKMRDVRYCELDAVVGEIWEGLLDLPLAGRVIVSLTYFSGMGIRAAAEAMNVSPCRAWRARTRALRLLRDRCVKIEPMVARCRKHSGGKR